MKKKLRLSVDRQCITVFTGLPLLIHTIDYSIVDDSTSV